MRWRWVRGFKGKYKISDTGLVLSVLGGRSTHNKSVIRATHPNWNGYLQVTLKSKGRVKRRTVHRMVAEAFIPNPQKKRWINHKNGIKKDNTVSNLEWCTPKENIDHQIHVLNQKIGVPKQPLVLVNTGQTFESHRHASKALGIHFGTISIHIKRGSPPMRNGFVFKRTTLGGPYYSSFTKE